MLGNQDRGPLYVLVVNTGGSGQSFRLRPKIEYCNEKLATKCAFVIYNLWRYWPTSHTFSQAIATIRK